MPDDYTADVQTTGAVAVGDTATGNIGSNGDSDWFAVELVAGRTYVIDLRGGPTDDGTLSDPYLRGIHDSDGNLIARTTNDDGGEGYNSRVTFTATGSGTHYIAAGAAGIFSGRGTYEVEVTDTSPPIVAPDPDSEDPPVAQEQVQQQPPAFGSEFYGFELPENMDGSANRISLGTVSAVDPEGDTLTYSIEGGDAAGLFEIDATGGELFYTGGGEDYETGSTSFELTVRASDGDQTTDTTATVSVTDVDEPVEGNPPVAEPDPARAAAEDLGDITELAAARFPRGALDGGADGVAWYRFTLSGPREVALGLRRQDADADLVLEDAEGNVLHSSERSGTANEWMRETLPAGTYYVRVEAQEAGANAYVFRYGVGGADPAEVARLEAEQASAQEQVQQRPPAFGSRFYGFELPENADGSANRISLGTVSAVDPEGGSVTYSIEGGNAAGLFEIDAAGGELFYTGGGEDYETGSTSFELTVRASDGDQTTDATATVSVTDVDEPVEVDPPVAQPDQSTPQTVSEPAGEDFSAGASTSGRVAVGDTATGEVGSNGDSDWFAVELVAGRTYVIDLRGGPTDDGTLSDPYLRGIHDSDGNLIARTTNDDGGQGYNSRVTFTATGSGTHYIAAGAAGIFSGRGTYEVEVTDTSPPIVAPDPDPEDPPVAQEQVQQQEQEQDEPPAVTVVPPAEPETAQAQDEAASVSEGGADLPADVTTPGRVVVGGSATGRIGTTGDRDWFAVELEAGKTYRFDLEGSPTGGGTVRNPYLRGIYDSEGRYQSRSDDDDDGYDRNSRVYFTPDEGAIYYVSAGAVSSYRGTYTLTVTEIPDDYAADPTTTGRVVVGGSATGNIEYNGTIEYNCDTDWFAVTLEAGKLYRFGQEGSGTGAGTLRDTFLRGIYDANGELIDGTTNYDYGVNRHSQAYFRPDEDATYYVSAGGGYGKDVTGTYTLTVTEISDDSADDYAADPTTTGTVVVGGSATGNIDPPGDGDPADRDWFAVDLEAGKTYRFDLEGAWTGGGTLDDPYLRGIYDANGDRIDGTTNDDGGQRYNSRVYFTPDESATYYVSAGSGRSDTRGNAFGIYTLTVTEISDDYAADLATTGTVVVDGSATGHVEYDGDTDWFAVELEAGKAYRFDLEGSSTGDGTLGDPYLRGIYDANGDRIDGTTNDNGGAGENSRVYFAPDEGATYYVSAGAFADSQGTYTLRVTDLGPVSVSEGDTDLPANSTTPGRVMVDSSATGNIEYSGYSSGDRDWFAVDLEADKTYRFDLEGAKTGDGTLDDPYLRGIYDEDGDRIDGTSDWSSGVGLNSRVFFTPDEGATYYVSAGSNSYNIGTYTLTVTDVTGYPDDYAADPTTTGTVVVGGSATGDVEYRGDADWFAVTLEAGKAYYFDLKGSPTGDGTLDDPYLRGIYDEEGDRFDRTRSDDTGVGQRNSRVLFSPDEDATYYVSAGAYGDWKGTYTLSVTEISDDYAADPATTGTVVPDGSATGDVEYHGDRDWFAVTLEAGKTYRFDLEGALDGGGNLWNPYLRGIYDAKGELIDGTTDDDSPGVDRSSQVYFRPDEDATYYVSAAGAYRDATGTYTLVVTEISDDYAADPTTTGTVAVGGSATGNIEPLGDRDWFAVDLKADKAYQFDLQGRPGGGGTLRDTVLRGIYDSEGRYQSGSYNDDFGGSRNSRVLFTPDEDATYYVSAGGHRNHVGTYTLSVEEVDAM